MTQYANPNLTQRDIVEASLVQIETALEHIEQLAQDIKNDREAASIDYKAGQVLDNLGMNFNGLNIQLTAERERLTAIIARWDAEAA